MAEKEFPFEQYVRAVSTDNHRRHIEEYALCEAVLVVALTGKERDLTEIIEQVNPKFLRVNKNDPAYFRLTPAALQNTLEVFHLLVQEGAYLSKEGLKHVEESIELIQARNDNWPKTLTLGGEEVQSDSLSAWFEDIQYNAVKTRIKAFEESILSGGRPKNLERMIKTIDRSVDCVTEHHSELAILTEEHKKEITAIMVRCQDHIHEKGLRNPAGGDETQRINTQAHVSENETQRTFTPGRSGAGSADAPENSQLKKKQSGSRKWFRFRRGD